MFGLYDIDGILRVSCNDIEACIAYAELLDLRKDEYSLMDLPESNIKETSKNRWLRDRPRQAKNNN
ncbi:hypothetical protein [Prochlorococcus marinus]|uniref:Uncharacterized protein n=1 Tax=Prochlorococcus marinus (strain MIT 9211) TaxID=93059 RepID=A9BD14_PROM4|nr:hypothetical protein [Prochlorococcus marinus]ABX08102.1 Hypothetical protein P9211_01711 [Prochlorococcus marinus str. MIT 9211]